MADIKWIKITTDIFDDEKILLIESMPDADAIIVIWFKLLCLAGKTNNSGVFTINDKIAYTDEMLSTIFRRPLNTIRMALDTFEDFGMIDRMGGVITIPNWEKHQNIDTLEKMREQSRISSAKYREKQKLLSCNVTSDVTSDITDNHGDGIDKNREDKNRKEENRKEKNREDYSSRQSAPYQLIADTYNSICVSFPRLTVLSDKRKKTIKARLNSGYTIEDFERLFTMAEESSFLKGKNSRNWSAKFDWLIEDANMAKVLDGNYADDKSDRSGTSDIISDWLNA